MGYHPDAAPVKHVMHSVWYGNMDADKAPSPISDLLGPFETGVWDTHSDAPPTLIVNGWECHTDTESVGKKAFGYRCSKLDNSGFVVWMMNESEYEMVGCYEMTFFSNDRASLEQFRKDFDFTKFKIEDDDVIVWMG